MYLPGLFTTLWFPFVFLFAECTNKNDHQRPAWDVSGLLPYYLIIPSLTIAIVFCTVYQLCIFLNYNVFRILQHDLSTIPQDSVIYHQCCMHCISYLWSSEFGTKLLWSLSRLFTIQGQHILAFAVCRFLSRSDLEKRPCKKSDLLIYKVLLKMLFLFYLFFFLTGWKVHKV